VPDARSLVGSMGIAAALLTSVVSGLHVAGFTWDDRNPPPSTSVSSSGASVPLDAGAMLSLNRVDDAADSINKKLWEALHQIEVLSVRTEQASQGPESEAALQRSQITEATTSMMNMSATTHNLTKAMETVLAEATALRLALAEMQTNGARLKADLSGVDAAVSNVDLLEQRAARQRAAVSK